MAWCGIHKIIDGLLYRFVELCQLKKCIFLHLAFCDHFPAKEYGNFELQVALLSSWPQCSRRQGVTGRSSEKVFGAGEQESFSRTMRGRYPAAIARSIEWLA